jgi:hypothetical protein
VTLLELVAVVAAAALGGAVQATLGFGGSFVMVPVVTLVVPEALPGAVLLGLLPLTAKVTWTDRASLDVPTFRTVALARVPGILLGTWLVTIVSTRGLTLAVAVALLVAVGAAVAGREVPRTATSLRTLGFVSGVTGTAVALGGPPLALVFHRQGGAERRATMSAVFTVGIVLALASLAVAGEFGTQDAGTGALLGAALFGGSFVAGPVVRRVGDDWLRSAVLVWAAVGSVVAGARALL